jgi:hypothetical protein
MAMAPNRSSNEFLLRAVLFLILIVVLHLWWDRHRGAPPWSAGFTATAAAAITAAFAWFDRIADESEKRQIHEAILKLVRNLFSIRVLAVAYVLFAVLGLSYSSVIVLSDTALETNDVRLSPVDAPRDEQVQSVTPSARLARFPVLTGPFGRPFLVRADGYLPQTFDVYPITGLTVRLERDLRVSPSVLFRPPTVALAELQNAGSFVVRAASKSRSTELFSEKGKRSSFLVGRTRVIPSDLLEVWTMELEAGLTLTEDDARRRILSRTLLEWRRPSLVTPSVPIEPGMLLTAEVCSAAGGRMATAQVTVTSDPLIDVPMTAVEVSERCESSPAR